MRRSSASAADRQRGEERQGARRRAAAGGTPPGAAAGAAGAPPGVPAGIANVFSNFQGLFNGEAGHSVQAQQMAAAFAEATGMFREGGPTTFPFQAAQSEGPRGPPPASGRAMQKLPEVVVTQEELAQDGNDSCCICLEKHELGSKACKLPCGHLFHRDCVTGWLERHCTCPVCRFELQTDSAEYERGRVERMATRKRRYRKRELERKTVRQLRDIMGECGIAMPTGALMKEDLLRVLLKSDAITVLPDAPPQVFRREELSKFSVGRLRKLMAGVGLSAEDCIEKKDMVDKLVHCGDIRVIDADEVEEAKAAEPSPGAAQNRKRMREPASPLRAGHLRQKDTEELQGMMQALGIAHDGLHREEIIQKILQHTKEGELPPPARR